MIYLFLLFLSCATCSAQPWGGVVLRQANSTITNDTYGLVAWYPFDANGNDISGNGNNLTMSGSPSYVAGTITNAVSLNGTSQSGVTSTSIVLTNNFTITAWILVNANTSTARIAETLYTTGFSLNLNPTFNGLELQVAGDTLVGPATLTQGIWWHVAATYDGTTGRIYTNGVLQVFTAMPPPGVTSLQLYVGQYQGGAHYLNGKIDDLRIYDRTLSAGEILSQFQWPTGGRTP